MLLNALTAFTVTRLNVRFHVLTAANMKFRVFWGVAPCSHTEVDWRFRGVYCLHHQDDDGGLMMEAVHTSERSVNFNVARRYISEVSKLYTRCRENLKSHIVNLYGEATLCCFRRLDFIALMMGAVRNSQSRSTTTWLHGATSQKTLNFRVMCQPLPE
jgi:hypothetical protein